MARCAFVVLLSLLGCHADDRRLGASLAEATRSLSTCYDCPAACPKGIYCGSCSVAEGKRDCSICPAGTQSAHGVAECQQCAAGKASEAGATICSNCPENQIPNDLQTECLTPGAGTNTSHNASCSDQLFTLKEQVATLQAATPTSPEPSSASAPESSTASVDQPFGVPDPLVIRGGECDAQWCDSTMATYSIAAGSAWGSLPEGSLRRMYIRRGCKAGDHRGSPPSELSPGCYVKSPGCTACPQCFDIWTKDASTSDAPNPSDGYKQNAANDESVCLHTRKAQFNANCGTTNTEMRFIPPPEDWDPGCYVKQACPPHASFSALNWTRDTDGEANQNAANDESICLQKRKADFDTWCNTDDTQMRWVSPQGALAVTGRQQNLAAQRPVTSSSSLHTNAGGHFDHYPQYAVDGLVAASPIKYHHSHDWATPWFKVDLGQLVDVSSVRVTGRSDCCGNWMDGFNILVGCEVCQAGLAVPQGLTGDFLCSPRIAGSSVTIVIPGEGRSLVLDEVEVFSDTLHNDTSCYASTRYPRMNACGACDGPGPSQCTSCQDPNHAFVPWRRGGDGTVSGSCHDFEENVQYIAIPGQGVPRADELTQFFTKWGTPPQSGSYGDSSFGTWIPSDNSITGREGLPAFATCRQYKTVECQPADQASNQSRVCETKKESQLVSIDTNILSDWQRQRCELDGGTKSDPHPVTGLSDFCLGIPASSFAQSNWTSLSNVNMLCETQVALL